MKHHNTREMMLCAPVAIDDGSGDSRIGLRSSIVGRHRNHGVATLCF